VAGGLVVFIVVISVAFALVGTYATQIDLAGAGVLPALFFGIVLPCGLYAYIGSLRRLGRMRKVLQSNPWKYRAAARKHPRARESQGIALQLKAKDGDEWGRVMTARNPLRWYRWDPAMEQGIWLAGVATTGAVIALPGGRGLMTLERGYWDSASCSPSARSPRTARTPPGFPRISEAGQKKRLARYDSPAPTMPTPIMPITAGRVTLRPAASHAALYEIRLRPKGA
jgi:hypothetical protein